MTIARDLLRTMAANWPGFASTDDQAELWKHRIESTPEAISGEVVSRLVSHHDRPPTIADWNRTKADVERSLTGQEGLEKVRALDAIAPSKEERERMHAEARALKEKLRG